MFFLAYYISNGAYYMNNFHYSFELQRIKFNKLGGGEIEGEEGKNIKKMLIISICFIEFLLQRLLLKIEQIKFLNKKIKWNDNKRNNIRTICSII